MKNKFKIIFASLCVLCASALSASAFDVPTQAPAISQMVTNVAVPNNGSTNLTATINLPIGPALLDYLTLSSSTVCTNTPVNGNTTISWKFAFDSARTNFINSGTLVYANTSTTNAWGMTNIPAVWWRGATAMQVTSVATTGQTNGANGSVIGQTTSVFLRKP